MSGAGTIEVGAPAARFARGSVLSLDLETGRDAKQPLLKALRKAASIDFAEGSGITIVSHADNSPGGLGDKVVLAHADSGKITGNGVEDIIVGSGKGSQNGHVVVFDGAVLLNPKPGKAVELPYGMGGSVRASLYAFVGYSSGVAVRLADLNDDGFDDIVMAPGTGAGTKTHAHLRVWNGKDSMTDFEAGKPLPYDYRWEMSSFWAFGEGSNPGGGMALSIIRQAGPDLIVASQLFGGGSKVFRYDGQKVLTTVLDMTGWKDLYPYGNTVVGFDRGSVRYFANSGTDPVAPDTVFVRTGNNQAAYTIDRVFGGTPGGLRLGLANMDADAEDELLVICGTDSNTRVYDLFADKAVLIDTLKPGGRSGWV